MNAFNDHSGNLVSLFRPRIRPLELFLTERSCDVETFLSESLDPCDARTFGFGRKPNKLRFVIRTGLAAALVYLTPGLAPL